VSSKFCQAVPLGPGEQGVVHAAEPGADSGKGLHSSTFRLNVSAFYGKGGAIRGCVGGVMGDEGLFRVYFVSETA